MASVGDHGTSAGLDRQTACTFAKIQNFRQAQARAFRDSVECEEPLAGVVLSQNLE
jgi:hypothetical protein